MKKPIIPVVLLILIGILAAVALRSYKNASDKELAVDRATQERADAIRQRDAAEKRAAAQAEASRLAELQANQDARAAARQEALAAQAERDAAQATAAAQAKSAQVAEQLAELRRAKADAENEARSLQAERDAAAKEREAARARTLKQLDELDQQRRALAQDDARLKAAMKAAQPVQSTWKPGPLTPRDVQPTDYKRRAHEYQEIFMANDAALTPPAPKPAKP